MSNISLDSVSVSQLLELFKAEMKKMDDLVSKMNMETNNIKKTWQGEASDKTLERINGFNLAFDAIKKKNEGYVSFIDYAINKYKELDASEKRFVDERKDAFYTSYYDN